LYGRSRSYWYRLVLQLLLLLLFLLRHVMTDHTPGGSAHHGVMSGNVTGDSANHRALDTALRRGALRSDEQRDNCNGGGEELQLRVDCP
jgi:hypothetical protein